MIDLGMIAFIGLVITLLSVVSLLGGTESVERMRDSGKDPNKSLRCRMVPVVLLVVPALTVATIVAKSLMG